MKRKDFAKSIAEGVISYSEKNDAYDVLGMVNKYLDTERRRNRASVYVPKELTKQEKVKVGRLVNQLTGERVDSINYFVDDKLIDGIKFVYKDKMWDFSLQNEIASIVNP